MAVDVIFTITGMPVTADLLDRASELEVSAIRMPVLSATDLVIFWLRSLGEHHADFAALLTLIRPLREQVDWGSVRAGAESPFAEAFLLLLQRLGVVVQDGRRAEVPLG